ncbi:hypothetical protein BMETH_172_2 [methanotrophic bacterial endosymbiont of Bathymodiolus sp.]|nr:hypothetical protein BMETH_172_2 [methanotrophic bacterial endosymbiont of Bathymodiolus sp.]
MQEINNSKLNKSLFLMVLSQVLLKTKHALPSGITILLKP